MLYFFLYPLWELWYLLLVILVLKWSALAMGGDRHQLLGYLVLLFLGRDAKERNLNWGTLECVFLFLKQTRISSDSSIC